MYNGLTYNYTRNSLMRIDGFWQDDAITLAFIYNGVEESRNYKTYLDKKGRYFKFCTRKIYDKFGNVIKYVYEKIYLSWFHRKGAITYVR